MYIPFISFFIFYCSNKSDSLPKLLYSDSRCSFSHCAFLVVVVAATTAAAAAADDDEDDDDYDFFYHFVFTTSPWIVLSQSVYHFS